MYLVAELRDHLLGLLLGRSAAFAATEGRGHWYGELTVTTRSQSTKSPGGVPGRIRVDVAVYQS